MKKQIKQYVSILLSVVLIFSVFQITDLSFISLAEGAQNVIASGTFDDPILISDENKLIEIIKNGGNGYYYKLTTDINISGNGNWLDTDSQICPFSGTIDGDYHVISGLKYDGGKSSALIPIIEEQCTTVIKNLGIEDSAITSSNGSASALVAEGRYKSSLVVSNTYVGAEVSISGANAGVVLANGDTSYKIDRCYSLANIASSGKCGFIGDSWTNYTKQITNTYVVNAKVIDRVDNLPSCTNVYTSVDGACGQLMEIENMHGKDALTDSCKMIALMASNVFTATRTFPKLTKFMTEADYIEMSVWDGTIAQPTQGIGTATDPYLIENAEQLAYIIKNGWQSYWYKITNNLYLNDISKWTFNNNGTVSFATGYSPTQWLSRGNNETTDTILATTFGGNIDGDGHTIYGMYYDGQCYAGLISMLSGNQTITIKNLGIDNAYVKTTAQRASALIADANGASTVSISNCYIGSNVSVESAYTNNGSAGAFYGFGGATLTIENCYSLATIISNFDKGLFGNTWNYVTIKNSYNGNGPVSDRSYMNICAVTNTYSLPQGGTYGTYLESLKMQGTDVLTNTEKMPNLGSAFIATGTHPILRTFATKEEIIAGSVWDGTVANSFAGGDGTESNPYLISNGAQLAYAIRDCWQSQYYKLVDDIYLNDINKINWSTGEVQNGYTSINWLSRGENETSDSILATTFGGNIDGNYHTIYGMYYDGQYFAGLIPMLAARQTITVKNLGIDKAYVKTTGGRASALIADANGADKIIISNSFVGANVTIDGTNSGSFYGFGGAPLDMDNCYSLATLSGTNCGLIGDTWVNGAIDKSYTTTNIIGNVHNTGLISGTDVYNVYNGIENMIGLGALTASDMMPNLGNAFTSTVSFPVLKGFPYTEQKATIVFDTDGGTLTNDRVENIVGSVIELPTPTKEDYTFKAWYTDFELTEVADCIMPEENSVYYAKWYKKYDVNKDATPANALDLASLRITLLTNCIESETYSPDAADCNNDGIVNICDLVRMKKLMINIDLPTNAPQGYELVWSDEFEGTSVSDNWELKNHNITDVNTYNDKITVSNGVADFSLTKDTAEGKYAFPSQIVTDNTMNYKYGYVEIRAKAPFYGMGEFPAFWSLANDADISKKMYGFTQKDYNFELDIFENMSSNQSFQSQIHLWDANSNAANITGLLGDVENNYTLSNQNSKNDWHTYGMLWTEDEIMFYFDGIEYCGYDVNSSDYKESFNNYCNLMITLSYYTPGNLAENSTRTEGTYFNDENTELNMQIDYVRLYQNKATDYILVK